MYWNDLFKGRLSRKGYWLSFVTILIVFLPFTDLFSDIAKESLFVRYSTGTVLIVWLISIFIRRFHDLNKPSIWSLLLAIPIIDAFVGLYLGFWPAENSKNRYGKKLSLKKEIFPLFVDK